MSQDKSIVISVPFHGDTITCVETPDGLMVAVTPICNRLGLASNKQISRLKSDETRWRGYHMVFPSAGGEQETFCIPITRLAAWLFSINANMVKPELREGLIQYQTEAADVLDRHFRQRRSAQDAVIRELQSQLYHSHLHLRARNPDWAAIEALWKDGCMNSREMAMVLRSEASLVDAKRGFMENCGLIGTDWCKEPQRPESMLDHVRDLEWQLAMKNRAASLPDQPDLFEDA